MRTSTRCNRGVPRGRTRWARGVTAMLTSFLLSAFLIPTGIFAQNVVIDGNAQTFANEWSRAGITHVADKFNLVNQDTIFGGSSKDYYYAGNTTTPFWTWVLGTAKDKDDIANGAAALVNAVDTGSAGNTVTAGAPFLVFAGDRISNSGDAQIGFWFFQDGTAPVTGGYFSPDKHAPPVRGDILVLADFTNGGRNAAVTVLEWVGTGGNYAGNAAFNQLATTEAAVAENNNGTSPVPSGWLFKDKNNNDNNTNTTTYSTNEFYEGYVALGTLFGNVPVCFSRFMLETRSTHEITATLDDFVGGPLGGAPQPLSLTGSTVCAGTAGTITSTGSVSGLSYQLYDGSNATVQTAQTGTGSALTWSNIPIGNGYYVVTTNTSTHCTATSTPVNITSVPNPTANAGPDQTLCQTAPSGPTSFTLAGTASNGTTAWTQVASTGTASASITTPTSLTSTVSVSGIGTVTLRLTTTSNTTPACGTATDDVVLTVNANPTANAGPDQASCQTKPSGPTSFTLAGTASNGTTAWTQVASTGTASASITTPTSLTSTVSVSGIGSVTLRLTTTSASCGTATDDVVLTVNANPTANAGPDQTMCQTAPSGPTVFTLAGTATNGTPAWSVVTTSGGASATITTPSSLTSTVSVSGTGSVTLRLTTTSTATPSCGTATDDVVLTVNANPTANAGPDQTLCQTKPSGPTSFTLAGTASNGTTAWTQVAATGTASASITTPTSLTSAVSVSGTGTVTLRLTTTSTATPSCGTATDDVVLTVNANPTANAGPDQTLCQTKPSGPTSFTLAGTASNGTTAWTQVAATGTASASITTPTSLTSTVSVSGIGTVTLRLTTTSGTGCGTATDDVILTVVANATNNAGPDQTLCQTAPSGPTSFTLAGTAANGTSTWSQFASTGTASASITTPTSLTSTVSVSGIGSVTLRLTTVSDCGTVTDDVVLTVNANPTANAGPDQTLCQTKPSGPTSFTLAGTASNGTTAWTQVAATGTASASITTPTSLTSTVSVSGIGSVTLRLTTTSGTGCGTATDDVVLTVNANPTANAGPDQTQCRNASGTNTFGTNTFTLAGTASNGTTAWSIAPGGNPQGYTVNITTPTSLTSTVDISGSAVNGGTVTLRLTTTSASCGTATDDVVLTLNALPLIQTLTATNFCPNASTGGTVTLANSQTGVSYQLQKDGSNYLAAQNGTGSAISWSPVPAGVYTVVGTVLATSCNTTSGPASVSENSVPDPTADPKDVCTGNSVALTGTPSGGTWSGAHVTGSTFDATGLAAGPYTVTYTVTNTSGCQASVNATVTVHALPTPTADNKEVCVDATVALTGTPTGGTWSGAHVTGSTFDATGLTPGGYTVTYTVTDTYGCTGSTTATVTVKACGGPLCTYTQGYYGNTNGNSCDADGTGTGGGITYQNPIALITAELLNGNTLTVGIAGRSVYLPVPNAVTTATRLNSVMPGNSTPRELVAGDIDINSAAFTTNYLNKQGRINNVLLSQTITLGLNMRISSGLPTLVLQAGEFATAALNGPCGTTTTKPQCTYSSVYPYSLISDSYTYKTITADVIAALNTKGYPLTVTGLFMLANDALGNADATTGSEAGASLSAINAAVTAINEGFDGCRVFVGWNVAHCAATDPNAPVLTTASRTTGDMTQTVQSNKLAVSAYPNPFNDVVRFTIQSKVSGNAKLTVYNMMGQQMNVIYNGFVQANKNIQVQYKAPAGAQESLIYILSINGEKVTGKVLNVNR